MGELEESKSPEIFPGLFKTYGFII